MRRRALHCDAWHPLGLGLVDLEQGMATVSELATRAGRAIRSASPRATCWTWTDGREGRSAGPRSRARWAEVAADVKRVKGMGADWMTFDLPRAGIPAMTRAMERLVSEVKPAAA